MDSIDLNFVATMLENLRNGDDAYYTPEKIEATIAALRQSPGVAERDAVDLERFRLPVEAWQSRLDPNDADEADAFTEADNLLAIIDAAGAKGVGRG